MRYEHFFRCCRLRNKVSAYHSTFQPYRSNKPAWVCQPWLRGEHDFWPCTNRMRLCKNLKLSNEECVVVILLPLAKMCSVQDNITADACFVLFFQSRLSIILGKCHGNSYIILVISCHVSWWRWNQIVESVMQVILDLDLDLDSLSLDLQTCIQQYTLLRKLSLLHVRFIHQTFRKGDIQIQNRPPTPRRCAVCGNWIHFIQGGEECFWGLPIILLRPREEHWVKGSFFYLGEGADCCQVNLIKWKQSGWQHVLICISNENVLVP